MCVAHFLRWTIDHLISCEVPKDRGNRNHQQKLTFVIKDEAEQYEIFRTLNGKTLRFPCYRFLLPMVVPNTSDIAYSVRPTQTLFVASVNRMKAQIASIKEVFQSDTCSYSRVLHCSAIYYDLSSCSVSYLGPEEFGPMRSPFLSSQIITHCDCRPLYHVHSHRKMARKGIRQSVICLPLHKHLRNRGGSVVFSVFERLRRRLAVRLEEGKGGIQDPVSAIVSSGNPY